MVTLQVNGQSHKLDIEDETPLLWAIRDVIGLTGTKYGCGIAQCGACTVHVDGEAIRSCSVSAAAVAGKEIVTIEALSEDGSHPVQKAWIAAQVPQCGYCQSGMVMAVAALLKQTPKPTDDQVADAISNICRCGTYQRVREAIRLAGAA
ncbi:MAG TPA: (2Fe-2S)-binding protein [Candidatus Cybelea sp.]|nr:(2Fe-2S)-binding protein [Candidatus Cybelea sp.]